MKNKGKNIFIFIVIGYLILAVIAGKWAYSNYKYEHAEWEFVQHSDDTGSQAMFYTLHNTLTGTLIVVDGGWTGNADHVRSVINEYGGTVDLWIVTHFHEDHMGAYNAIQADPQGIEIKEVYASAFDSDYEKFLEVANYWDTPETFEMWMNHSKDAENVYHPVRGEIRKIDNLSIKFYNTYDDLLLELNGEADLPNNCALVFRIEGVEDSILFMADMYAEAVGNYMIDTYGDEIKSTYVQGCHHGNSVMPNSFYEFVEPEAVMFDAPEWLMLSEEHNAKTLKEWCDVNGIAGYDYRTAPNEFIFK